MREENMLGQRSQIRKNIIFMLLTILILSFSPSILYCQHQRDNITKTKKLQNALTNIPNWLLSIGDNLDGIQSQGQYYNLLARVEVLNKTLKMLKIDQEDFIESVTIDKPDIKRINTNIRYLRDMLEQVRQSSSVLNSTLKECNIADNLELEEAIIPYIVMRNDNNSNLDQLAQNLLGEETVTFSKSRKEIEANSKDFLVTIKKAQVCTEELYKKIKTNSPSYEP